MINPILFGVGVGIVNGVLARARDKPVTGLAVVITTLVIGISEGALVPREEGFSSSLAAQSSIGVLIGLAPFALAEPAGA